MTFRRSAATSVTAIFIGLGGTAALADVTPAEVWSDWNNYMAGFGYEMSGTESTSGGTLTISDMTMTVPIPEEDTSISISLGEISFADNGDGTVSVQLPETVPMVMEIDAGFGEPGKIALDYNSANYSMVVSGDSDRMLYTYSADLLELVLKDVNFDGESIPVGSASMSVAGISGTSESTTGDLREVKQELSSGPVAYNFDFADPEGEGKITLKGGVDSLSFTGGGAFPSGLGVDDFADLAAVLKSGFAFDGTYGFGPSQMDFLFSEPSETVQLASSSQGGELSIAMDEGKLQYGALTNGLQINMTAPDIPLPVELAMEQFGLSLLLPISASEEEQDFGFTFVMDGLNPSDGIWGMVDLFAAGLPHDPLTLSVDVSGKARVLLDLLDPENMEALEAGEAMPGEITSVNLNGLTVRAAGAELTGEGAFEIDNDDLTTFGGVPAPSGMLDVTLTGANALLDKLVAAGLLPEEQATMARFMSGTFMVAGEGEDTLESKIEVGKDGSVTANGQRLK